MAYFKSLLLPHKSGNLALYIGDLPKISFEKQERFLILKEYENCTVTMLCFILKSTLSIRKLCDYTNIILIPVSNDPIVIRKHTKKQLYYKTFTVMDY